MSTYYSNLRYFTEFALFFFLFQHTNEFPMGSFKRFEEYQS